MTYPSGRWGHALLSEAFPTSFSFLPVGIPILFQVTHLSLSGIDLLLARQAPKEDGKVCLQLKKGGMRSR